MTESQEHAAWIAFGIIGGGALNVLVNWLYCLAMNAVIERHRVEAEPLRSFTLVAFGWPTVYASLLLWVEKRHRLAALILRAGCAMMLLAMP